ncbi:hypothetical protein [Arthrobacter wenxiniae]|uniref:Uncharacterized protein n=1 Tax=Arthrobacter wenxiniae TaxID=2713570 RepID=A0A7Y7IIL6_9MICC|nr:hypothetical protein [Arthrobacter wenxiniae]NVM96141.1 hypothetical protein [Arthrobacter wenxiniae]
MATTSGVIITTIHQFVIPLTIVQSEGPMSETPNAPEMNDHIQDAMLARMLANMSVIVCVTVSCVCDISPHPGGHHPPAEHLTMGSIAVA